MAEAVLAIDIGGTFTDVVVKRADGRMGRLKVPSAAAGEMSIEVPSAIGRLLGDLDVEPGGIGRVVHGSTVATNAVLQLAGPRTALLTTRGFRDVLELRRIRYPERYNPFWRKPPPLVPRRLRFELTERVGAAGEVVVPLDLEEVRSIVTELVVEGVESIAVCLLNAYRNPVHEEAVRALVEAEFPGLMASYSSRVVPIAGEYERTSTTACDAYVKPIVRAHQERLETQLRGSGVKAPLLVMQSSGSLVSARQATDMPVFVLESGPAAGVVAAAELCGLLGLRSAIAFDMGGTTAKACMIEGGEPFRATEYEIGATASVGSRLLKGAGYLLRVRSIDVAEVGAGGGSQVEVDIAGGIQVGPESAGANPGPVCYGRGSDRPTVTDANLVLGYINPVALLSGELPIDAERARAAWQSAVAARAGMSADESALGAHRIANANMERAVRLVSSERGFDPRTASLIAFGGSGPVHAASLAAGIGIRRILVPPAPGVFSAVGLLTVGVGQEFVTGLHVVLDAGAAGVLEERFAGLEAKAAAELGGGEAGRSAPMLERLLDLRYEGQHRELTVRFPFRRTSPHAIRRVTAAFRSEFQRTFGYATTEPVTVENIRLVASVPFPDAAIETVLAGSAVPAAAGHLPDRRAVFGGGRLTMATPIIGRGDLDARPRRGPFIIEEYDSTTVVPPDWTARRDGVGNIVMELGLAA